MSTGNIFHHILKNYFLGHREVGYNYGDGNQYGLWRLEVTPKKASKYDNFLHVLHPSLKREGKINGELIESESGNICGAHISKKAVIFSRSPQPLIKGSYAISHFGPIWQLLCNLKPERRYQIKQDGKPLLEKIASKQGILEFESTIGNKNSHFEFNEIEEFRSR